MLALLLIVIYLAISIAVAVQFDHIAVMKGYPENKYLWWCFWLGLPGWLMVIALPDRGDKVEALPIGEPRLEELPEELPEL